MFDDIRVGLRTFVRSPGFATLAVITLALGIAANTAILSVVHGVLLRPLPYPESDRLVTLWTSTASSARGGNSAADFLEVSERNRSFQSVAGWREDLFALAASEQPPLEFEGSHVSPSFFDVLGMPPLAGRTFSDGGAAEPDGPVVVLSEEAWRQLFAGDPAVIGGLIKVNGQPYTLLGVMPRQFRWPDNAELWVKSDGPVPPSPLGRQGPDDDREVRYFQGIGRLRPDVTMAQVDLDLARLSTEINQSRGAGAEARALHATPLGEEIVGNVRPVILILQAGVGLVLLIACVNISSLLIARTTGRQREMAVRAALGATAGRLVRQLLTESLVLGVVGGLIGLLVGSWFVTLLLALLPNNVPRTDEIALDGTVAVVSMIVAVVAGMLFGALPAIQGSRTQAAGVLRATAGRGATTSRAMSRSVLVVGEVALTLVLLVAAGLLANSLARLERVDPGFGGERVTIAGLVIPQARYTDGAAITDFYARLLRGLAERPEFEAAGIGFPGPFKGDNASGDFTIAGREDLTGSQRPFANLGFVSGGFFDAMGIDLLQGRTFSERDGVTDPPVAIVSAAFVRKYWPGENAIGKRVRFDDNATDPWITIVGVTSDVHQLGLHEPVPALMYFPYTQVALSFTNIAVRSRHESAGVASTLRTVVAGVDPELPFSEVLTLDDVIDRSLVEPRFRTFVFGLFALVALVLAAVGVYGLISYTVAQQTREIGIRVALGAAPRQVIGPIVRRGALLALTGVGVGLVGSWFAARALGQFLFGITATDPATFAVVAAILLAVSLLASYLPSRRALGIDPITALRAE